MPTLLHQNYCFDYNKIENNQNIIYVKIPDKKQDGR